MVLACTNWQACRMGRLHPPDFPLRSLDDSERRLAESLIEYTDSTWLIMPTVRIGDQPPVEIDMVVAHHEHGIGVIEVKGYVPRIVDGSWVTPYEDGGGPVAQMIRNRFALRELLRKRCPGNRIEVDAAIAFVNARGFQTEERPSDIDEDDLIWSMDHYVIDSALLRFMRRGRPGRRMFDEPTFESIVEAIRPNVAFDADPAAYTRWGTERLEAYSGAQIRSLERLDANRRVFVTGGAGTGKSRLALAWARRAAIRGERTLMVCFNDPLSAEFERRLGHVENLTTGAFLRLALSLEGMPFLQEPDDDAPDEVVRAFWRNQVQGHLHEHWADVVERYDTIVVDEVQDFSQAWLAMLETLLDPEGPRRFLLVGDADQELYQRGFRPPRSEDGWAMCELASNTRNALEIARLLRNRFNGPPAPAALPSATHLRFRQAAGPEEIVEMVRTELEELRTAGFECCDIAVATLDRHSRNYLRASGGFDGYGVVEDGDIVCETVHRLKGLEYSAVVLVADHWPVNDTLMHVGVSRAVFGLTVIGPAELGEYLRLS